MSDTGSQPPGWYYAQGDPPGTQRYWDGSQWQGAPQPVGGAPAAGGFGAATAGAFAEPGSRFVAALIDWGLTIVGYIVLIILVAIFGAIADALGTIMLLIGWLGILGFIIYNYYYLQGTTGQTIGKQKQGIKLINEQTQQPVGIGMAFVRYLLGGILGQICLLDYWWIFVDDRNQRLSDNILKNVVVKA